jgi:hypothetical protein
MKDYKTGTRRQRQHDLLMRQVTATSTIDSRSKGGLQSNAALL